MVSGPPLNWKAGTAMIFLAVQHRPLSPSARSIQTEIHPLALKFDHPHNANIAPSPADNVWHSIPVINMVKSYGTHATWAWRDTDIGGNMTGTRNFKADGNGGTWYPWPEGEIDIDDDGPSGRIEGITFDANGVGRDFSAEWTMLIDDDNATISDTVRKVIAEAGATFPHMDY